MKKVILPGLLAGLTMLVISMLLTQVNNIILPDLQTEYTNPALFRPWSDPLMSLIFVEPFIVGLILAWLWHQTKCLIKSPGLQKGLKFGLIYGVIGMPGMIMSYSSFPISLTMTLSWTVSGFIQVIGAGLVLAKLNK
jgi:hypothetical protein